MTGLHDARYCEIIELQGAPPDATATVWNTIGLNRCPAALVERVRRRRAGQGARRDRSSCSTARATSSWTRSTRRRRAACAPSTASGCARSPTIPIRTAADLVQTPVHRPHDHAHATSGAGSAGRTVFELVAPGGDVYVMQSLRADRGPELTLGELPRARPPAGPARGLALPRAAAATRRSSLGAQRQRDDHPGRAAEHLPAGDRRARRRRRASATRVQHHGADQDRRPPATPGTSRTAARSPARRSATGTVVLDGDAGGRRASTGTFRLTLRRGSVLGHASTMPFTITGDKINFRGTARITGGTGAYRGITSGALADARPQHARRPARHARR